MSRSSHTTRRDLLEARLRTYRDAKVRADEIAGIEDRLDLKRRIKASVSGIRRTSEVEQAVGLAGPIPVRITDVGPHIIHPASPEDLEAIQQRLPGGVLEGLSEIVLSLGAHNQAEGEKAWLWDPDPVTKRLGPELLPGLYKGWIWGTYQSSLCRITLHALVADPKQTCPMPTGMYFKLQSLSTFVHEVAHHFDHTRRVAAGRWLAHDTKKVEHFADRKQHEWTQNYVVPYLEATYPQAVDELLQWLETHGRIRLTLGELVPDPRVAQLISVYRAVDELVKDVVSEKDLVDRLFNYSCNLKYSDMYGRAQQVIDAILVEEPEYLDALELRASIWNFQERYADAAAMARHVLDRDPQDWQARTTLTRAYEGLGEWEKVIAAATESLTLFKHELDRNDAIESRCMAYWKLGKKKESDRDLKRLQKSRRAGFKVKRILREREETAAG